MHKADLQHSNSILQEKLEEIFQLRRTRSKVNWDRGQYLELLESFGNPHLNLPPVIHVAGTNGKGSIIAILRSVLEAQGLQVHCYTSPHLIHVNERIVLAGQPIGNAYLEELIDLALANNEGAPLSFFEITTALAFKAFSEVPADILLLEVGMGGRLDCTNVIEQPLATVINRVSYDHTEFLGNDISGIAAAKAGIMKKDTPCITGYQGSGEEAAVISKVFEREAEFVGAKTYLYESDYQVKEERDHMVFSFRGAHYQYPLPTLHGAHQVHNAAAALATIFSIRDHVKIDESAIVDGLTSVQWRGRLQNVSSGFFGLSTGAELWLDCGHNDSAAEALQTQMQCWQKQDDKPLHLIVAMLQTKDPVKFLLPLLPYVSCLHIVPISSDSSCQTKDVIEDRIRKHCADLVIVDHENVSHAIREIAEKEPDVRILVAGSAYLVGEVLEYVEKSD